MHKACEYSGSVIYTVVQTQNVVSVHFTSEQKLPFGFAEQYKGL